MAILFKLPPNDGHLSIVDKFFKNHSNFVRLVEVSLSIRIGKTKLVCQWVLKSTWPITSQKFWKKAEHYNFLGFSNYCVYCFCVTIDSLTSFIILDFMWEVYQRKLIASRQSKVYATKHMRLSFQQMFLSTAVWCYV